MTQISLFDGEKPFKIDKPIRLITLFSGYDSQALALKYLGANFEHYKTCEWAYKSIQALKDLHFGDNNTDYSAELTAEQVFKYLADKGISADYNAPMTYDQIKRMGEQKARMIYNNIKSTHNLVNIMQAKGEDLEITDTNKYCYVMTYSFPCQDLSKAGQGKGMGKGSGTRSGLLWEVERLLDELENRGGRQSLPQVLVMENVPDVIGSKNIKHFADWVKKLEQLGYYNKWEVLNAKDYGIPQNRERCFMVSILADDVFYEFPQKQKLELRLRDLLEKEVDEKYYLSDKMIDFFKKNTEVQQQKGNGFKFSPTDGNCTAKAVTTRAGGRMDDNFIEDRCIQAGSLSGGNLEPKIAEPMVVDGYNHTIKDDKVYGTITTNSRFGNCGVFGVLETEPNNMSPTLDTRCDCLGVVNNYCIRKLTPGECWRLMGVDDSDFEKVAYGKSLPPQSLELLYTRSMTKQVWKEYWRITRHQRQSNSSLYHLAGDSIVANVLMGIFKEML